MPTEFHDGGLVRPVRRRWAVSLVLSAILANGSAGTSLGSPAVVVAVGTLDARTAPYLRDQFVKLARAGRHHLVVDLDGVECLDATGLGVLVGAVRRVQPHGGSVHLICSQQRILDALAVVGLAGMLPIYPSLETAVAA